MIEHWYLDQNIIYWRCGTSEHSNYPISGAINFLLKVSIEASTIASLITQLSNSSYQYEEYEATICNGMQIIRKNKPHLKLTLTSYINS